MIVALLNQKGGVGKTTLAQPLAGSWAHRGKRTILVDADPHGSALDWSQQRDKEGLPKLFGVIGLSRDTLHREAPEIAKGADHVVIDGPPRIAALLRSALLAADLVLVPAQPSPFDGWTSGEMLKLIDEARIFRSDLIARFVLNRCPARTIIVRGIGQALAAQEPPVLSARVGQRVVFADAARHGRLVNEASQGAAAARGMTAVKPQRGFAARPSDPDAWVRTAEKSDRGGGDMSEQFTAQLTIDITPNLRGRIKIIAFQRGLTVADLLRDLLDREFPEAKDQTNGGAS
jgi:chromosome partitioning protein